MQVEASGKIESKRKLKAASLGGAVAASFASAICCLGPLVFAALGLGGAGLLAGFEAYRPYFAALTFALLGAGFYLTYRRPSVAHAAPADATPGCACERPVSNRRGRAALWVVTAVVAVFLGFPYFVEFLLG